MIAWLLKWLAGPGLARLAEFFQDGKTRFFSAKRLVLIMGGASLSIAVLILARKSAPGNDVSGPLWAVSTPLAAMGGAGYVMGKYVERKMQAQAQGTAAETDGGAP